MLLFRDDRVPLPAKSILVWLGLYLLSPIDIVPDFIPVIGHLDDVLVLALGLWLFLRFAPREVVLGHIQRLREEAQDQR